MTALSGRIMTTVAQAEDLIPHSCMVGHSGTALTKGFNVLQPFSQAVLLRSRCAASKAVWLGWDE